MVRLSQNWILYKKLDKDNEISFYEILQISIFIMMIKKL
jgi:hypothetical protein